MNQIAYGDYTFVRGARGSVLYIHEGYIFVKEQVHHGIVFTRCLKKFCPARGRINLNDDSTFFDNIHSHGPPPLPSGQ
jgi:hypothetical protein